MKGVKYYLTLSSIIRAILISHLAWCSSTANEFSRRIIMITVQPSAATFFILLVLQPSSVSLRVCVSGVCMMNDKSCSAANDHKLIDEHNDDDDDV